MLTRAACEVNPHKQTQVLYKKVLSSIKDTVLNDGIGKIYKGFFLNYSI